MFLNFSTLGNYGWVWFWKNWEDLHQWAKSLSQEEIDRVAETEYQKKILKYLSKMNVTIHTIALVVEGVRLFFLGLFFWQLGKLARNQNNIVARQTLLFAILFAGLLEVAIKIYNSQMICAIVLVVLVQMVAQIYINDFWKKIEPEGLPLRNRFTANEYLLIGLGAASIGLILSTLISPMPLPSDALHNP